jgi:hypothetical protein
MKSRWTLHVHLEPENTFRSSTPQQNNPTPGENSPLAPKAGIRLPFSRYGRGPTLTRLCRHGEGHTMPLSPSSHHCRCPATIVVVRRRRGLVDIQGGEGHATPFPEPAEHRGIEPLYGNVSRCRVTQASSFLSVIMISLTWHTLQASHPYQPRLFSPALGILSTCVRPLSSTSKRYARGRASPSPTDGCSPAVQPPSSSSSRHCRRPAATVVVRRRVGHVDWQGYEGHVAPCPGPAWYRGI